MKIKLKCPNCKRRITPLKIWHRYYEELEGEKKKTIKKGVYKEICPYCDWTIKQKSIPVEKKDFERIDISEALESIRDYMDRFSRLMNKLIEHYETFLKIEWE